MTKQAIAAELNEHYRAFADYITHLTSEEYTAAIPGKWNAGQQLAHIILSVKPLVKVYGMEKSAIEQTFGRADKQSRTYDVLLSDYIEKLYDGGKAPERYIPPAPPEAERKTQYETLLKLVTELSAEIDTFSEAQLDSLLIPHPLLGNLTLREMLFNSIYHVQHHQMQTTKNLELYFS